MYKQYHQSSVNKCTNKVQPQRWKNLAKVRRVVMSPKIKVLCIPPTLSLIKDAYIS